ncbi:MAG: PIN domain-containing protein [Thiolinea sp.]
MSGILVDTCIWSDALRNRSPKNVAIAEQLKALIDENRVKIIGVIRLELLSGYSDVQRYEKLRGKMQWFPNEAVLDEDYETAARFSNICRTNGVQGSHIDFLICAVAVRLKLQIFTTDRDFLNYAQYLPVKLFQASTI